MKRKRWWFYHPHENMLEAAGFTAGYSVFGEKVNARAYIKIGYEEPFSFDPTDLTVEEIQIVRDFMNQMFDDITPTSALRDAQAEETLKSDRPDPRTYRTVPTVHRGSREQAGDDLVVPERPEGSR